MGIDFQILVFGKLVFLTTFIRTTLGPNVLQFVYFLICIKFTKSNFRRQGSLPWSANVNIVRAYLKISLQGIVSCTSQSYTMFELEKSIETNLESLSAFQIKFVSCSWLCFQLFKEWELNSGHTSLIPLKTVSSHYSWIPYCRFAHLLIFICKPNISTHRDFNIIFRLVWSGEKFVSPGTHAVFPSK